ncbi:MAG TPA: hypothetical protein VF175_08015, partial [Lacipirellula sp.]
MRLTLRTLLAYMDDILDPADQEELGRKIESSPFATELIHRSRDAVRRLRLSAPDPLAGGDDDIHGGDPNLDANTASEYLDNTLPPEEVADFERACLEAGPHADMLLAEAAACHHVLTMVLGEPAEVDSDLRQRMYALAQSPAAAPQVRVEGAHATASAPIATPPIVVAAGVPPVAAPRAPQIDPDEAAVPDYMLAAARERRRTRRMAAALVGAVLIGGGLTWFFMTGAEATPPEEVAQIGRVEDIKQGPVVGDAGDAGAAADDGADEAGVRPGDAESVAPPFNPNAQAAAPPPSATEAPVLETPPLDGGQETPPQVTLPPAVEEEVVDSAAMPSGEPGTSAAVAALPEEDEPTSEQPGPMAEGAAVESAAGAMAEATPPSANDAAVAATEGVAPSATPGGDAAVTSETAQLTPSPGPGVGVPPADIPAEPASTDVPGGAATVEGAVAAAAGPMAGSETADPAAPAGVDVAGDSPAAPKPIGAYLGNNDVLLQYDEAANAWVRLPPRSAFVGGERLLSLPTFRTHVVLADVNAYLTGGTQIELAPPGDAVQPPADFALHIPFGRVVLNSGLNGNRIELSLVDQTRVVELGPSSSLAIEVRRIFQPGALPNREPAPAEITWYLTSGTAKWGETGQAAAPATWTTIDGEDSVPAAIEELPEWVDRAPISDIERRARERVAEALVPGQPVNLRLLELSDPNERGRRTEDRALAARSGAY